MNHCYKNRKQSGNADRFALISENDEPNETTVQVRHKKLKYVFQKQ